MFKFGSSLSARNILSMFDQKFGIGIGPFGTIKTLAGKKIKRNSPQGKVARTKGGTQQIGAGGALASLAMLPRSLAILGIGLPVGGALTLASALVGSANLAGRASLLATSGVMRAAGGLAGGGQSGNVKKDKAKQIQMVQSALNKKEPTGKGAADTGIANIKSTLADYDAPEGAMSMLPTGNEDGMGMLSGMLHQIAVNTSYLGGIDSKIDALVGLSSISVIDQAQETKGGSGNGGGGGDGVIKRSFNSLKDTFSSMGSTLGGAGRALIKGLGLLTGFLVFKKFEPQITGGLASLFENVSGFFESMGSGGDPGDGVVAYFDSVLLPSLVSMAEAAIEVIFRAIKIALNKILPGFFQLDTQQNKSGVADDMSEEQIKTAAFFESGRDLGNVTGYAGSAFGILDGFDIALGNKVPGTGYGDVTDDEREYVMQAVRDRLQYMYDVFTATDGRVRWTEIGPGFTKGEGIDSLQGTHSVADILYKSQPIVDGTKKPGTIFDGELSTYDLTGAALDTYIEDAKQNTRIKQKLLMPKGLSNILINTGIFSSTFDELETIFKNNEIRMKSLRKDDGASLGNGQGEILASIDASNNSQVMNETTVSGPTQFANLNVAPFMNANIPV